MTDSTNSTDGKIDNDQTLKYLLQRLPPHLQQLLFAQTPSGAATVNPAILMRNLQIRGLLRSLINLNPLTPRSDGEMPQRNVMEVPAQPFGNEGVHAQPFPGARLPNAYQGPLTPAGQPGVPDAPEVYVPGHEKQWLRRT